MGYKKVVGKIAHAKKALGDVRLHIDVSGGALKGVFKGEVEVERLSGVVVRVYIPKIYNKKKEEAKVDKGVIRRFLKQQRKVA